MNQKEKVLQFMKEHKQITRRDAALLGVMELSSRIGELMRDDGIKISNEWITVTNRDGDKIRVKRYWLTDGNREGVQ